VQFRVEQRVGAPIDAVDAALIDPTFIETLTAMPKIGKVELVAQSREGDDVEQEVRYVFAGELSSAVRAVVDPRKLSWIIESNHDLTTHAASWRIIPDHYRERLTSSGTTKLEADGDATRRIVEGDVKIHMALVGGRVERAIVSGLKEHFADEVRQLEAFLHQRSG
jgi:hypothetical protein